ncbi:amidohydrolase family protein [bacterium]|nr:amidohydrolase family protein [candidate division CSSED10-310 bacterium]
MMTDWSPSPASAPLHLRNVRVVDVVAGTTGAPVAVTIHGGRIASIGSDGPAPEGAMEIDCTGGCLIPGLFDCHTHLGFLSIGDAAERSGELKDYVSRGVLYARDVGSPIEVISAMKRDIDSGAAPGPEIFYTGPMLESEPLAWEKTNERLPGFTVAVNCEAEARRLLPELARQGAVMIKTFNNIPLSLYRTIVAVAADNGLRIVHDPGAPLFNLVPIHRAMELGVTSIEHAKAPWPHVLVDGLRERHDRLVDENGDPDQRRRLMMEIAAAGLGGVSEERLRNLAAEMAARDVLLCPTLHVFDEMEEDGAEATSTEEQGRRRARATLKEISGFFVEKLAGYGVPFLVGSDSCSAAGCGREMRLMGGKGVSTIEILRGATLYPARWLGVDDLLGSIAPGKRADLVLLERDPLEDIDRLADISMVVQRGMVVCMRTGIQPAS